MSNNIVVSSKIQRGVFFAVIFTFSGIASCGGGGGSTITNSGTLPPTIDFATATIASESAAWAALPMRAGSVYHYCDCGTGAESDCVAGANANPGTAASPKQTIASAISTLNSSASGSTVALCKGGAFNAVGQLNITPNCTAGTTCRDLREYDPTTFTGTAKPIINNPGGEGALIQFAFGNGGVRILNIMLNGGHAAPSKWGVFLTGGAHDITLGNVTIDRFDMGIYSESTPTKIYNTIFTGNNITNNVSMGYLGISDNSSMSYNNFFNNGNDNSLDHQIYLSSHQGPPALNFELIGNYIYGQSSPTCLGGSVVAHGNYQGLTVVDNVIEIADADTTGGCWGLSLNNYDAYKGLRYFRDTTVSGNIIINGGNKGLDVSVCPGCVIENNVVIFNTITEGSTGIDIAVQGSSGTDDVNTANIIRNNTIYFGPGTTGFPKKGIIVHTEGTGYIVANNTVYYGGVSGSLTCFDSPLPLGSYAFINNNHCYSAASYLWEAARGSLAAWQSYSSAYGFDTASKAGSDPLFTNAPTDFTPATWSPLIGAGNNTYKSALDIIGKKRPDPPAIGAYEP